MTIEDRVRQLMAAAVADEPPPVAPLQVALRRRRRRPVLIGATAVVLVLAAVVGLVAIRERRRPLPITDPTAGWILYRDAASNLQLRHPPDWVLRERAPGWIRLAPPEQAAGVAEDYPPFAVGVFDPAAGYLGGETGMEVTRGRFPSGRAYTATEETIDLRDLPPDIKVHRTRTYTIDWDRKLAGGTAAAADAGPGRLVASGGAPSGTATGRWPRPSSARSRQSPRAAVLRGPRRPACRPGQWRLFHPGGWSYGDRAQRYVLEGGVESLGGRPATCAWTCGWRSRSRPDGVSLAGNPSTTVVEGDLPDDAQVASPNSSNFRPTPLAWHWAWQEWCNKGLPQATLRITAGTGASITVPGPPLANPPEEPETGCQDRGRPSSIAPWP